MMADASAPRAASRAPYRSKQRYICQFCGYDGTGWKNKGDECPKCGRNYDYILAQDSP